MGAETLVIGLKAFCQLYEMAVNYSLGMSNIKSQVKKKPSVNEERKDMWASSMKEKGNNHFNLAEEEIRPRRNSLKGDEENLCAICFDKQIQIMLPCLVNSFYHHLTYISMVFVKNAVLVGTLKNLKPNVLCAELLLERETGMIKYLQLSPKPATKKEEMMLLIK